MKLVLVTLAAVCYASAARLENNYLPPPGAASAGGGPGLAAPVNTYLPPGGNRPGGYRGNSGGFGAGSGSYNAGGNFNAGGGGNFNAGGGGNFNAGGNYNAGGFSGGAGGYQQQGRPVAIIRQTNENNGDGTYTFSYETEDGTAAEESGQLKPDGAEGIQAAQGSFSFTAPDANRYTVTYVADENGFQPQGAHLPTPPPIPEAILKSLQQNAADEARGIVDDGSYGQHSGGPGGYGGGYNQNAGAYNQNAGGYNQNAGGYNQNAGGYNQNAGGYNQNAGGYQQPAPAYRPPSGPAGFGPSRRPSGFTPNSGYQY